MIIDASTLRRDKSHVRGPPLPVCLPEVFRSPQGRQLQAGPTMNCEWQEYYTHNYTHTYDVLHSKYAILCKLNITSQFATSRTRVHRVKVLNVGANWLWSFQQPVQSLQ